MSNIQQSVNSVLTTSAALKALGEKRELKRAEEEERKKEEEIKRQKEQHEAEVKRSKDYIDALLGQKTTGKIDPKEEVEKTKEKVVGKRSITDYNAIEELNLAEESARSFLDEMETNSKFKKGMMSAKNLYRDTTDSLNSFEEEYINRKSDGGNKQW